MGYSSGRCLLIDDWSLSKLHIDHQLSLQSNRDVPLLQNIFRRYIQASTRHFRKVHINLSRTLSFTGIFPLQWHTKKSNHETQQQTHDPTVFRFLKESHVFLPFFHFCPPQLSPLRHKTTKTNEFGLLKRSVKTSPTSERRSHRGVCVSCSPPAEALTSRGFSRASCGAKKSGKTQGLCCF